MLEQPANHLFQTAENPSSPSYRLSGLYLVLASLSSASWGLTQRRPGLTMQVHTLREIRQKPILSGVTWKLLTNQNLLCSDTFAARKSFNLVFLTSIVYPGSQCPTKRYLSRYLGTAHNLFEPNDRGSGLHVLCSFKVKNMLNQLLNFRNDVRADGLDPWRTVATLLDN
jgi:hypothetical protein